VVSEGPDTVSQQLGICIQMEAEDTSGGSRSKFFDTGLVGSIFCCSVWVSHLWFGFGLGKFPLKIPNFPVFFPSDHKNCLRVGLASY